MSLLIFFVVHQKSPHETVFAKHHQSLRFSGRVSEGEAREYISKHYGEKILNGEDEIISNSFAEITHVQKAEWSESEISEDKVLETLKK